MTPLTLEAVQGVVLGLEKEPGLPLSRSVMRSVEAGTSVCLSRTPDRYPRLFKCMPRKKKYLGNGGRLSRNDVLRKPLRLVRLQAYERVWK